MAWIKFEKDLLTDPRVLRIAKTLSSRWQLMEEEGESSTGLGSCNAASLPSVTLVCGALVRIWSLADTHIDADDVLPLGFDEIDEHIGLPGFCALMPIEWMQRLSETSVKLPNFQSHNGIEAKRKAVTQRRVAAFRSRNAQALPDQTKTRPEKTRSKTTSLERQEALSAGVNGNAVAYIPCNDGSEFGVSKELAEELAKLYPAVNVPQTLNEIRGWNLANPQRRKTRRGVLQHINSWMSKEQNRGPQ